MTSFGPALRSEWMLDPAITYLNHGTVGAPPRRVLAAQREIWETIERQPAKYLLRDLADTDADGSWSGAPSHMRAAATRVANFVGSDPADLVFVDNATTGANSVLRSFPLAAGDEILVTDTSYGGVVRAATYAAAQTGATVRTMAMPPLGAPATDIVAAFQDALSDATRIVLVDHITAPTALILPVTDIAAACHERGALVLVDGAHGPGAIPLDIPALGVDWYFGNLHKWAWTPRSSGILWAAPQHQHTLHPTVISWGYGNGIAAEFDMLGTRDPSPFLAAPAALDLLDEYGFEAVCDYNHQLAWDAAQLLSDQWDTEFTTPESMIGPMATVRLPRRFGSSVADAKRLRDTLLFDHDIEVPVFAGDPLTLRVSAQIYLDLTDIERLAAVVGKLP
jgi:isopenicillin-N epimerase